MTVDDREQRIRERAFHIWIEEGQPQGKDREHWEIAKSEITGEGGLKDQGEGQTPAY